VPIGWQAGANGGAETDAVCDEEERRGHGEFGTSGGGCAIVRHGRSEEPTFAVRRDGDGIRPAWVRFPGLASASRFFWVMGVC
jgi:hypothetical protein